MTITSSLPFFLHCVFCCTGRKGGWWCGGVGGGVRAEASNEAGQGLGDGTSRQPAPLLSCLPSPSHRGLLASLPAGGRDSGSRSKWPPTPSSGPSHALKHSDSKRGPLLSVSDERGGFRRRKQRQNNSNGFTLITQAGDTRTTFPGAFFFALLFASEF